MNQKPTLFEPLEARVFLDGSLENLEPMAPYANFIEGGRFSYEGDNGKVNVIVSKGLNGTWEVGDGDLYLFLEGTDSKTSLRINGNASIGGLDAQGGLGILNARNSDIRGEIELGDVRNISLRDILEEAEFNVGRIGKISVNNLSGFFNSGSIGSFLARGDINNASFEAANEVGSTRVLGSVLDSSMETLNFKKVDIKGRVISSTIDTEVTSRNKLRVGGDVEDFSLGSFYNSTFGGNLVNGEIEPEYIKNFYVKGSIDDVVIRNWSGFGTIERLNIGNDFKNSSLFLGWNPGADAIFHTDDDVGVIEGMQAKPLSVYIRGAMENSYIVAKEIGRTKLGRVVPNNSGVRYGLFSFNSADLIDNKMVSIGRDKYSEPIGDFVVELLV